MNEEEKKESDIRIVGFFHIKSFMDGFVAGIFLCNIILIIVTLIKR